MRFLLRHLIFSGEDSARLFGVPIPNGFGEWLARTIISRLDPL